MSRASGCIRTTSAASPARATTYAYVNPVVAILLGWGIAGETLTSRIIAAREPIAIDEALVPLELAPRLAEGDVDDASLFAELAAAE